MPKEVTIPLTVMFRFFPTVFQESEAISDAMKMRGIKLGGKKSSKADPDDYLLRENR